MPLRGRENKTLLIAPRQTAARAVPAPAAPSPVCLSLRPSVLGLFLAFLRGFTEPCGTAGRLLPVSAPGSAGGSWGPPRLPSAAGTRGPRAGAPHTPREGQVPAPFLRPFGHRGTFNLAPLPRLRAENGGSGSDPGCGARSCAAPGAPRNLPLPGPKSRCQPPAHRGKKGSFYFFFLFFPPFFPQSY